MSLVTHNIINNSICTLFDNILIDIHKFKSLLFHHIAFLFTQLHPYKLFYRHHYFLNNRIQTSHFSRTSHSHLNSYKPGEKKTKIHIQLLIKLHPQTKIKNPEQTVVHSGDLLKYLQIQIKLLLQLLRKEFLQKLPCEV